MYDVPKSDNISAKNAETIPLPWICQNKPGPFCKTIHLPVKNHERYNFNNGISIKEAIYTEGRTVLVIASIHA